MSAGLSAIQIQQNAVANRRLERRIVKVPVSPVAMAHELTEGSEIHSICTKGLPAGALYVGSYWDEETHCAYFLFAHESFKKLRPTEAYPELAVRFEVVAGCRQPFPFSKGPV